MRNGPGNVRESSHRYERTVVVDYNKATVEEEAPSAARAMRGRVG